MKYARNWYYILVVFPLFILGINGLGSLVLVPPDTPSLPFVKTVANILIVLVWLAGGLYVLGHWLRIAVFTLNAFEISCSELNEVSEWPWPIVGTISLFLLFCEFLLRMILFTLFGFQIIFPIYAGISILVSCVVIFLILRVVYLGRFGMRALAGSLIAMSFSFFLGMWLIGFAVATYLFVILAIVLLFITIPVSTFILGPVVGTVLVMNIQRPYQHIVVGVIVLWIALVYGGWIKYMTVSESVPSEPTSEMTACVPFFSIAPEPGRRRIVESGDFMMRKYVTWWGVPTNSRCSCDDWSPRLPIEGKSPCNTYIWDRPGPID